MQTNTEPRVAKIKKKRRIYKNSSRKIWVLTKKSSFMQRILDYVRSGHNFYAKGEIPTLKLFEFYEKIEARCALIEDRLKASRARAKGLPCSKILLYQSEKHPEIIHFFVMLWVKNPEDVPSYSPDSTGQWRQTYDKNQKLSFGSFEVVRITKALLKIAEIHEETKDSKPKVLQNKYVKHKKIGVEKPIWTWQYKKNEVENLREGILYALKANQDGDLRLLLDRVFKTPGFAGSRKQLLSIRDLFISSWPRFRGDTKRYIVVPEANRIGYLRRIRSKGKYITKDYLSGKRDDLVEKIEHPYEEEISN